LLYHEIEAGTLSDYSDAVADTGLWSDVSCAIFMAIQGDGGVTSGNFAAVISNLRAITYAHPGVITTIADYAENMGAAGMMQAQQHGSLFVGDCSGCGWCYTWDFLVSQGAWATEHTSGAGAWTVGVGWESDTSSLAGQAALHIEISCLSTFIASVQVAYSCTDIAGGDGITTGIRNVEQYPHGPAGGQLGSGSGAQSTILDIAAFMDDIVVNLDTVSPTGPNYITAVTIYGTGTCPFGTPNC
jgi:hypothetical protein